MFWGGLICSNGPAGSPSSCRGGINCLLGRTCAYSDIQNGKPAGWSSLLEGKTHVKCCESQLSCRDVHSSVTDYSSYWIWSIVRLLNRSPLWKQMHPWPARCSWTSVLSAKICITEDHWIWHDKTELHFFTPLLIQLIYTHITDRITYYKQLKLHTYNWQLHTYYW